jgi:hypothetical protein
MFRHGPSKLSGPVSRESGCWQTEAPRVAPERDEDRPIRTELVERVRREIAEGTYDTPEKWEKALDRLLERLEQNDE